MHRKVYIMKLFHHYLIQLYNLHKKKNLSYFASLGLTQGQPKVIEILYRNNGCSQKFLADACELQKATITSLLKKMESDNLIHRKKDVLENGIRITKVFLTDKGMDLASKVIDSVIDVETKCFKNFTAEEKALCFEYLERIYINLKNMD